MQRVGQGANTVYLQLDNIAMLHVFWWVKSDAPQPPGYLWQ